MQSLQIEGLTQTQQVQVLASVPAKVTKVSAVPLKVTKAQRRRVTKQKAEKPFDTSTAGSLANVFYWLESPNLVAALHQKKRSNKNIVNIDCVLCENGKCDNRKQDNHMHYKVLPLNWSAEGCAIIRCQRKITKLQSQIQAQDDEILDLKIKLGRTRSTKQERLTFAERQKATQRLDALYIETRPIHYKISALNDEIIDYELRLLPLELAINGVNI